MGTGTDGREIEGWRVAIVMLRLGFSSAHTPEFPGGGGVYMVMRIAYAAARCRRGSLERTARRCVQLIVYAMMDCSQAVPFSSSSSMRDSCRRVSRSHVFACFAVANSIPSFSRQQGRGMDGMRTPPCPDPLAELLRMNIPIENSRPEHNP